MIESTTAVIELVSSILELSPAEIPADASMETIAAWDSLAQLNICMMFQDRFNVVMDMTSIAEATSIPALVALLV